MSRTDHPYTSGWPTWPFTRLSPRAMAKLLKTIEGQRSVKRLSEAEEALL
jgi:hypothetical protein